MLFSNLIYLGLAFYLEATRRPPVGDALAQLRLPLTIVAGAVLVAGGVLSLRLRAEQESKLFQTTMILCLALLEACTIDGLVLFFVGLPAKEFAVFAGVSLAAQALLVLPKVLAYRDARQ